MDIVERLQGMSMMEAMTWVTADKSKRPENIYSDAADEIERLRGVLRQITELSPFKSNTGNASLQYITQMLVKMTALAHEALKEKV